MPDLCGRLHEEVSHNDHRFRDFRRSGHAYSGQHYTVPRLSGDDKNGQGAGVHLPYCHFQRPDSVKPEADINFMHYALVTLRQTLPYLRCDE